MNPDTRNQMKWHKKRKLASSLLINSSRPVCDEDQLEALKTSADDFPSDRSLAEEAERHGLAPLVSHHLSTISTSLNDVELKKLRIQFVRNRNRVRVQMKMLEKMLSGFGNKDIGALVLKGGALCNLIYPDPALRPLSDLDILVKEADAPNAFAILSDMGFTPGRMEQKHHMLHALPEMSMLVDGITVLVDIHKNVFTNLHPASLSLEDAAKPLISFRVGDQPAFTLGHEEMLLHLCHHLITPGQAIRLISVSDIVGFVTRYADDIQWERIHGRHRFVINALRLLDLLVPFSDPIREKAGFQKSRVRSDIGVDYQGWPKISFGAAGKDGCRGYQKLLSDSMAAPEWWLRLHYGYDEKYPIWFCRYVLHLLRLSLMGVRWMVS
jgi:hypothetical protein